MKKLLSAFSLNMLSYPEGDLSFCSIRRPNNLKEYQSYIGNSAVARELNVNVSRGRVELQPGDECIIAVANLRGLHPDDDLPPNTVIKFYKLTLS